MKVSALFEAMWLPGFGPNDNPIATHGEASRTEARILPFAPAKKTRDKGEAEVAPLWPMLESTVFSSLTGEVSKYEANLAAIDLLRMLEKEQRQPTCDERAVLNQYTGWGGIPKAFNLEQRDQAWVTRAERLKSMLDDSEYRSAKASTPNAHFTALEVIKAMWAMVQRLGFKGGRILEPSAGVGYFIGAMPEEVARNSKITAVELDEVSAAILKALYRRPYGVHVLNEGFEACAFPQGYFDLAISNVPFGSYQVPEMRNVPYQNFLIHDYFFAKALEVVRPGGLVVFITSSGTMDKYDDKVRRHLAGQADLVAAVRLPNTAFKRIANTEVTTDILILQKPLAKKGRDKRAWTELASIQHGSPLFGEAPWHREISINRHFAENPQWVIGKVKMLDNGYGKAAGCVFDGDIEDALKERVEQLPQGLYTTIEEDRENGNVVPLSLTETHRPGYRVIDGKVYEVSGSEAMQVSAPQKTLLRIAGMVEVRDAARKLIVAQATQDDDGLVDVYRVGLNMAYDKFVGAHGYLHAKANKGAFKGDPDLPLLLSLELWDAETQSAEKADVFSRRTVWVNKRIERCETPEDALTACLAEHGRIVPREIGELLGYTGDAADLGCAVAMAKLEGEGLVYQNPVTGYWETADAYLSGNVKAKHAAALLAGARYERNVKALAAVIPADLSPSEIGVRIGSTWIPTRDYEAFLNATTECTDNKVSFSQTAGAWNVDPDYRARYSVAATQTFGTERMHAITLFEMALNQTVPTVYDPHPTDENKRVVNQKETIAAREKQQHLKERFVEWLWGDEARATRLVRLYNDQFNNTVPRKYDGKHLKLPGFSRVYRLRDHQLDGAWRVMSGGVNTLLGHLVGAGKTLTMICAGMELRRIGKASKPLYVVPNHMLEQFAAEFLRAYPGANILMATKDDLAGDKRRHLLSRIATCDWDGVLITQASFERLKMSDEFMEEYIQGEVDLIEEAIQATSKDRGNRIVKELARAKKSWEAKLAKLTGKAKKDDLLTFEDLGVDWLFIDEAHSYKNLWRHTKMTRVAGLPNSNSERAFDMFVKTRYVMDKHQGKTGVVFATGTPVSNSMAEMWVMQRYLQPKTLEGNQVGMFDTWAGNFGESVTSLELAPDGSGYRMQTRFARFVNLPELMSMFREVADIRTAEMLSLPVPTAIKETVTVKPTEDLRAFVQSLVERAEEIRNGKVTPSQDNMLAVTNDGRKAALDMRLVDPLAYTGEDNKIGLCAQKVHGVWKETAVFRGAQVVFCDLSTPHGDGRFSAYTDLRQKLVDMGIPGVEIAFIHDHESDSAKEELFKAVREGRVRVMLGSTSKMGVGTNVQTRLAALHHLDAPWRPADVEQREGRIIRQGNLNETVRIFRYVTEGSFDAYIWQTLETKARFIAQVMQGDTSMRSAEDAELAALSYAEVKALASGNPLVLEKAGVDTELAKLALLKSKWEQQQWRNKMELANLPDRIDQAKDRLVRYEADLAARKDVSGKNFRMEVEGRVHVEREDAGKALLLAVAGFKRGEKAIGRIAGFDVVLSRPEHRAEFMATILLRGEVDHEASSAETPAGIVRVLENALHRMAAAVEDVREYVYRLEKRFVDLSVEVGKPYDKADRLAWLQQRQKEINAALDLSKGDTAAVEEAEASEVV